MKPIVLIVAHDGYQPQEYAVSKKIIEEAGVPVLTVSDKTGIATAKDRSATHIDMVVGDIQVTQVAGIFMIGGPGALVHLDIQDVHRVYNEAMLHDIPYGGICISPRILAKAHVLVGKSATGWNGDGDLQDIFTSHNVTYVDEAVVVDGGVITASGPEATQAFGEAIVKYIS